MTALATATDNSFDPEVLKCDIPVLAAFLADWSGPAAALKPALQELAAEHPEQLKVVEVDIESNPMVTSNYNVLNVPTLILFKNGQEVVRLGGGQTKESVLGIIAPYFDQ